MMADQKLGMFDMISPLRGKKNRDEGNDGNILFNIS